LRQRLLRRKPGLLPLKLLPDQYPPPNSAGEGAAGVVVVVVVVAGVAGVAGVVVAVAGARVKTPKKA